jgi:hypothetical protein
MVYSNLILGTDNNTAFNTQNFLAQADDPNKVIVQYNGSGIHNITGPVPLIDISNNINNGTNDLPESVTSSIKLQGKIVRNDPVMNPSLIPPTGGISGILGAITTLKKLFTDCPYGTLKVLCGTTELYVASGVIVKDINFSQTGDNWVKTADFDISMESTIPISGSYAPDPPTTNKTDKWTIEQVDDSFYTNITHNISHQAAEYSNPVLGATFSSQIPAQNVGGGNVGSSSIKIINLPQFRVTHSVSAKGLVPTTGASCTNIADINKLCLDNAKDWVNKQLSRSVQLGTPTPSGFMPFIAHLPTSTYFFNHIRSVNIDLTTYEVTDSWMAMPSGIPYTETYTLETSVAEDFTKSVRVVGNIAGLHPIHTGLISDGLDLDINNKIDTTGLMTSPSSIISNYNNLDQNATNILGQNIDTGGGVIKDNKYHNALSGWLYDIKPHLYRRACIVMNTPDRTLDYINPALTTQPPENPIYSRERPLSTIPSNITEGHDPRKGTISYSAEYKNSFKIISGVISETIDINYDVPHDEVATIAVPGRALGPILSRTGRSASRKTMNISVVVVPPLNLPGTLLHRPECPLYTGGNVYRTINDLIYGNKPFTGSSLIGSRNTNGIVYTQSDSEQWSPSQGRYSRNVQWIYQACSINKDYMEH